MNSVGDQETKFNDKRTEETESQRKPNQVLILEIKKREVPTWKGRKKTYNINHLAIMNYENRLLIKKRGLLLL